MLAFILQFAVLLNLLRRLGPAARLHRSLEDLLKLRWAADQTDGVRHRKHDGDACNRRLRQTRADEEHRVAVLRLLADIAR